MARRKAEIQLQQEVETNEQWQNLLEKEGLIVIDVYQSYGGPLKAIEPQLKALNNQLSDNNKLYFAIAKADTIDDLELYRGKSEPCFLFYAGKELVSVIRGANAPAIIRTITEQLAKEQKVLKGEAQRKPVSDPVIEKLKQQKQHEKSACQVKTLMASDKPLTIAIIKPDMIIQGKKDEIIEKIKEKGYEVIEHKDVTFNVEMATDFYKHRQNESNFEGLIKYMTSGESCVLALSKEGNQEDVINKWREDLGPTDLEEIKKYPNTLRAKYASDQIINALHGSDSKESAMKEIAFFFQDSEDKNVFQNKDRSDEKNNANKIYNNKSDFSTRSTLEASKKYQRTIAIIRPTAFSQHENEILQRIKQSGFDISMKRNITFDKQQAEDFYSEHKNKSFFNDLVNEMSSGPMLALCLVKEDAIKAWRELLGPKEKADIKNAKDTLRNEFDIENSPVNSLHGASTPQQAERELTKFFPMEQTIALLKPDLKPEEKIEIEKIIQELGFIIASKKSEKLSEDIAKEIYKNSNEKEYFHDLIQLMTSGETEILILSRENAIQDWLEAIGPVDPKKAKETYPNSLRAIYGIDTLRNGVHAPKNREQAEREIKLFFGNVKFDDTGKIVY